MSDKKIEIMDTTLRDGEQTSGISFSPIEKLSISKLLLEELKIDRIEVASARVSEGEMKAVKLITDWAKDSGFDDKIEILSFVDKGSSIKWMKKSGAKIQNLLTKGSTNHLKNQIKKTPSQHFRDISKVIQYAEDHGIRTNVYLEDWSNGMKNSKSYVMDMVQFLSEKTIDRILLPDTLGVLTPDLTKKFIKDITNNYPNIHFDFHAHNDYDLSVANVIESIKSGCKGIHITVNGMGERAGNAPLASVVAVVNDFLTGYKIDINEKSLHKVSKLVSNFSGFRIPVNKPIVGDNVFTQTAGIHADGDNKKNLYFNDLLPERFGRKRKYALGKMSGKANIKKNLDELGLTLSNKEIEKLTERIILLGDKKEKVTIEDLPYIISDVIDSSNYKYKTVIQSYELIHKKNLPPSAKIKIMINKKTFSENGTGDGQFDAFMNAIKKVYKKNNILLPKLVDYEVTIPPGSNSDALCETFITWDDKSIEFTTRGLDSDQTVSAIKATEKMLNII
ncbi:MAG: 2-isopropylmalate synthase [Bacteroidetes bacterium MED-G13]|nr:MAG: 2-isopropylmalate synthase [Bacteroidetes bacterium MED-G13]|tara:strand:- start:8172 stop:9689 length:1518 start_codon:yes stop_codon:yes gene_type:complete